MGGSRTASDVPCATRDAMTQRAGRRSAHARGFRATIRRLGPNPYVDVPEAVARAFAAYARAGRITFEGTLNKAPIRGTLIPVGRRRLRLYVNGGMRSAAGVGVGDTASFELRATRPEAVRPPADVAAALRRVTRARAAFDALSPPYRRELLRYIDDARTPEGRERRIRKTIEHVLGKDAPSARRGGERPLWTCPRCGNEFVTRNQYHSCRRYDLSEPFSGKPPHIRELFDRFRAMVESCGPVKMLPHRDKVGFMVRVRFHKIQTIYPNAHVHLVRITDTAQLDAELAAWIREAYAVGRQEHLRTTTSATSAR